ncbi:hypothetical protein AYI68_g1708 [Smittium mucronatum]|uniref:Uncharacterized protein n=1 Tax=Smittium mucronatum TaxID=133383 RepID=A0A1R0H4V3_9FUNG|nr:hypothetical protein AYI68_g1708 [Smittium mucronatum]
MKMATATFWYNRLIDDVATDCAAWVPREDSKRQRNVFHFPENAYFMLQIWDQTGVKFTIPPLNGCYD